MTANDMAMSATTCRRPVLRIRIRDPVIFGSWIRDRKNLDPDPG